MSDAVSDPIAFDLGAFDPAKARRIGAGASADVFALDERHAVKLMRAGVAAGAAEREFAATRVAYAAGLPVPAPFGLARVGDRAGLVLARLDEPHWRRRMRRWPGMVMATLATMARQQAALHRVVAPAGPLPSAHAVLEARIAASAAGPQARAAAQAALRRLPRGDWLGHGDLHLGNLMHAGGEAMLIDWAQAMTGDPAADVARSELVMRFGRFGGLLRRHGWARLTRDAAAAWYLACYRQESGMRDAAIDAWRLPVAVAWLREGSAAHLPALRAYIDRRLAREALRASRGGRVAVRPGRIQFD